MFQHKEETRYWTCKKR